MCFSVTASFSAGVALTGIGTATLAKTKTKYEIPLALIPVLFGIQQIIEGFVWLSFSLGAPTLNQLSTCGYTFFSHTLWPIFVPFAVALIETDPIRKRVLHAFQVMGVAVGGYLFYASIQHPITSEIINQTVVYNSLFMYQILVTGFYVTIVCGSFFVASEKLLNAFGFVLLASFLAAYYFYSFAFVSVWCFFAAVLSLIVYLFFKNRV